MRMKRWWVTISRSCRRKLQMLARECFFSRIPFSWLLCQWQRYMT